MASKIHSGGLLGGQAEKKSFFNASRTPQGPLLGSHLGVQNRSRPLPEAFLRCIWHRKGFWHGFGTLFRPILKGFLRSPRDKMISKNQKSDKVKIFQNTCVFTVRLHLRSVDNANTELAETLFFLLWDWHPSESVSGAPSDLVLGSIWAAKIGPESIWKRAWMASKLEPRFWGVGPRRGELGRAPETWTLVAGYIYTRISRAVRARSILSDFHFEGGAFVIHWLVRTNTPRTRSSS